MHSVGEIGALAAVQLTERLGGGVSVCVSVGVERLEQATTNDLEALVTLGRLPLLGLAGDDVGQPVERLAAGDAADLEARASASSSGVLVPSDAGIETTKSAPSVPRVASVSAWAKPNWLSKLPALRASCP